LVKRKQIALTSVAKGKRVNAQGGEGAGGGVWESGVVEKK